MRVRAYLSVVWGCPYEGAVSLERVVDLCRRLADMGIYQLSLGDTVGVGVPNQTEEILSALTAHLPVDRLALHLHDTRGLALANALVGLSAGVTTFDASIGGLGGCPYAPGAAGNLATEDVVNMLHRMGVETGIDLPKLVEAGEVAQELIGRKLSGKFLQAALGERDRAQARRRTAPAAVGEGDGMRLEGGCHCGRLRVAFTTARAPTELPLRACQCTFCRRHGGLTTSDPEGEVVLTVSRASAGWLVSLRDRDDRLLGVPALRRLRGRVRRGRAGRAGRW